MIKVYIKKENKIKKKNKKEKKKKRKNSHGVFQRGDFLVCNF